MALQAWPTVANRNVAQPSRVRLTQAAGTDADVYDVTPVPGTVVNEGTLINQALFDQMEQYVKEYDIPIHTTTGTGAAYAVSVPVWSNLTQTELDGHILCIIPNVVSTTVSPTLNMNGLGAKPIYAPGGSSTSDRGNLPIASYLTANVPVYLIYNKSGDCWITLNAATTPVATNTTVGTVKPDTSTVTIDSTGQLSVPTATAATKGLVKPDDATITVDASGLIKVNTATTDNLGVVKPDTTTISVDSTGKLSANQASNIAKGIVIPDTTTMDVDSNGKISVKKATSSTAGIIKPDGNTIGIDADGIIKANIATTSAVGVNKPDGKTITISSDGTLTSNAKDEIAAQHERDQLEFANALIGNKSGTLVNVDDAWGVKALKVGVDGKAAQVVTTGKNLLNNINKNPVTSNGITFELKNDGTLAVYGTATAVASLRVDYLTDYNTAVSACPPGMVTASGIAGHAVSITFGAFKQDGSIIANVAQNDGTFQYPADAVKMRTFVQVQSGVTINDVLKLQLELGSTATSYEPYTGGKPSPSPEYPQEVDVVDSPVMVQATGKNLSGYPYKTFTAPAIETINGVTFEAKPDGTIVANGTATANADVDLKWGNMVVPVKGLDVNISGCPQGGSGTTYLLRAQGSKDNKVFNMEGHDYGTGATISGANFIRTYMRIAAGTTANNLVFKPQIEIGSAATSYEPYTSNQQTITLPPDHNYLASLPDGTHDEVVLRSDGVAVLVERVGKRVFNGSEAWVLVSRVAYGFRLRDTTLSSDYRQLICDRYTVREFVSTSETQGVTADPQFAPNLFCFRDTTIAQTVDAWKAKLAASNVTVYYALATTTVRYSADNGTTWSTTDPAAGQSAIPLYKGTNNVWCTDALSPTVDLDYVQDTNKVIDKLRAAIVASGASS